MKKIKNSHFYSQLLLFSLLPAVTTVPTMEETRMHLRIK
ncbi:hypothetical protein PALA111701_30165 [Paenibacillus lactis]